MEFLWNTYGTTRSQHARNRPTTRYQQAWGRLRGLWRDSGDPASVQEWG
jgi:hypothetical protein